MILNPQDAGAGLEFAGRLGSHPAVRDVRWGEAARSLTVHFDQSITFAEILEHLPEKAMSSLPIKVSGSAWHPVSLLALTVLAATSGLELLALIPVALLSGPVLRGAMRGIGAGDSNGEVLQAASFLLDLSTGGPLAAGLGLLGSGESRPPNGTCLRCSASG